MNSIHFFIISQKYEFHHFLHLLTSFVVNNNKTILRGVCIQISFIICLITTQTILMINFLKSLKQGLKNYRMVY
jgi:hypothetical protein